MDVRARKHGYEIIPTPVWVMVVRIIQIVLSVIAIGLAGWWIHGLYLNELGFVIACCVFTWIISLYNILSEKASGCRSGYNTWATLSLDGLMVIFWLAAMGATASARSAFKYSVTATCTSDGSAINSGHCDILRRYIQTVGVATQGALAILSGLAGICALIMLLYVASFAYVCHFFRLSYTEANAMPDPEKQQNGAAAPTAGAPAGNAAAAAAAPAYPMTPQQPIAQQGVPYASPQQPQQPQYQYQGQQQQQQQQPQQQQSPMTPQATNMGYSQQTGYAQPAQGAVYNQSHTPDPYTQQNMHTQPNAVYSPGQVGQQQQQQQQYPYAPGMPQQGPGQ